MHAAMPNRASAIRGNHEHQPVIRAVLNSDPETGQAPRAAARAYRRIVV